MTTRPRPCGGSVDALWALCQLSEQVGRNLFMDDRYSRLSAAEGRLDDALARLETALAAQRGRPRAEADRAVPGEPAPDGAREVGAADLGDALAEAKRQNDALKALSRDAADRLDHAIAQIDLLLED